MGKAKFSLGNGCQLKIASGLWMGHSSASPCSLRNPLLQSLADKLVSENLHMHQPCSFTGICLLGAPPSDF